MTLRDFRDNLQNARIKVYTNTQLISFHSDVELFFLAKVTVLMGQHEAMTFQNKCAEILVGLSYEIYLQFTIKNHLKAENRNESLLFSQVKHLIWCSWKINKKKN